jgi:M6 family metalloprotease-like protein
MVIDALNILDLDLDFDFSPFDGDNDGYIDAIDFIHSGYGAETGGGGGDWIWSHRWVLNWFPTLYEWTSNDNNSNGVKVKVYDYHTEPALWGTSGTDIVRFGVIAHELGHFFGLPDLYDTDNSGEGIGSWGMMANSWGFDYSQYHPPHFSAWSKIQLGWTTPMLISEPGDYIIDQAETNAEVYRIDYNYPTGEYLLIENRQPAGIETAIPQGGLCIYHIDENADDVTEGYPGQSSWPQNGNHYRVSVLQADGNYDLEKDNNRGDAGDTYHANGTSEISPSTIPNTNAYQSGNIIITDNAITNISASAASMTFTYDNGTTPLPPQAFDMNIFTGVDTPITITLQALDDGQPNPPSLDYSILSLPSHGTLTDIYATAITSLPHTLDAGENQIIYTPRSNCSLDVSFDFIVNDGGTLPDGGDSNIATVTVGVPGVRYFENMDSLPDWTATTDSQWEWGTPSGSGGVSNGYPDPTSGHTGSTIVGYNLSGDYGRIKPAVWATTPAIDCTAMTNVTLSFYRWLNIGSPAKDHAYIEVSNDGSTWVTIWENSTEITDSSWSLQTFDISALAGDQATVYISWGIGETDQRDHYSGWNIDDVKVFSPSPAGLVGDFHPDCEVDSSDLMILVNNWLSTCPDCEDTDLTSDGKIDLNDLKIFAQNWLSQI